MGEDAYRIEKRINTGGFAVAYTIDAAGREKIATEAEVWLWEALQAAREVLKQRKGK